MLPMLDSHHRGRCFGSDRTPQSYSERSMMHCFPVTFLAAMMVPAPRPESIANYTGVAAVNATNASANCQSIWRYDCLFCACDCGTAHSCAEEKGCTTLSPTCVNNACWCVYKPSPPPPPPPPPPAPKSCDSFQVRGQWKPLGYINIKEQYSVEYGRTYSSQLQVGANWAAAAAASLSAGFDVAVAQSSMSVSGETAAAFSAEYKGILQMQVEEKRTYELIPGEAWQWQFEVHDSCGVSIVKGNSIVVTNSQVQKPCCLPGYFLSPENVTDPHCQGVAGKIFHLCKVPPPSPPSDWKKHTNKNCYQGTGAKVIWRDLEYAGHTLQTCQSYCASWNGWFGSSCTSVVQDKPGNCWLRESVSLDSCVTDAFYDTYVVDSGGNWAYHTATNCYLDAGGVPVPDPPSFVTSVDQCKAICLSTAPCDAIVMDEDGDCWLRNSVAIDDCDDADGKDTYTFRY